MEGYFTISEFARNTDLHNWKFKKAWESQASLRGADRI